jgi:heme exporter protein D
MITSASQWWFIGAAYGIAAVVIVGLIVWVMVDGRRYQAALRDLDSRGIRRRSAEGGSS